MPSLMLNQMLFHLMIWESFFLNLIKKNLLTMLFPSQLIIYSQHGKDPISYDEIREIAAEVGITIPERVDMTFKAAKEKGKNLFQSDGRGKTKPTVHGEKFLKDTFNVKKGNKKKTSEEGN